MSEPNEFLPTIMFGFMLKDGKTILHQMWVTPLGLSEWREVPMLEIKDRKPAVVGHLGDDNEDH